MHLTKDLRYNLRMMGVPIDVPMFVFCDNKSVVTSMYVPASTMAKKNLGICFHAVREVAAVGIHRIAHISGEFNPSYIY